MLTPVVDPEHSCWEWPKTWSDMFEQYRAPQWKEYWARGWCRVEAMRGSAARTWDRSSNLGLRFEPRSAARTGEPPTCSSVRPVIASCSARLAAVKPAAHPQQRAVLFKGGVATALLSDRRAHIIYGTKQLEESHPPRFLPPLLNAHFAAYRPEDGLLTDECDRATIQSLTAEARLGVPEVRLLTLSTKIFPLSPESPRISHASLPLSSHRIHQAPHSPGERGVGGQV